MATEKKSAAAEAPAKKKVRIKIPIDRRDNSDVFVGLNDETYLIKRGEEVEVPEGVAEILRNAEEAEDEAYRRMAGLMK